MDFSGPVEYNRTRKEMLGGDIILDISAENILAFYI